MPLLRVLPRPARNLGGLTTKSLKEEIPETILRGQMAQSKVLGIQGIKAKVGRVGVRETSPHLQVVAPRIELPRLGKPNG